MKPLFENRIGSYRIEEDFLWIRSPLSRADTLTSPLLVAQGANDPWVNVAESNQIVQASEEQQEGCFIPSVSG